MRKRRVAYVTISGFMPPDFPDYYIGLKDALGLSVRNSDSYFLQISLLKGAWL